MLQYSKLIASTASTSSMQLSFLIWLASVKVVEEWRYCIRRWCQRIQKWCQNINTLYNLSELQFNLSIYSTTSTFKIRIYEEKINKQTKICVFLLKIMQFLQIINFEIKAIKQINSFFFNNFVDYDLTL